MSPGARTVRWRGQEFHFEIFEGRDRRGGHAPTWGVWWRNEFIGTMPIDPGETIQDFELRSIRWLADLFPSAKRASEPLL